MGKFIGQNLVKLCCGIGELVVVLLEFNNFFPNPGYSQVRETDKQLSSKWGINESIKLTSVKPSGTVSLLAKEWASKLGSWGDPAECFAGNLEFCIQDVGKNCHKSANQALNYSIKFSRLQSHFFCLNTEFLRHGNFTLSSCKTSATINTKNTLKINLTLNLDSFLVLLKYLQVMLNKFEDTINPTIPIKSPRKISDGIFCNKHCCTTTMTRITIAAIAMFYANRLLGESKGTKTRKLYTIIITKCMKMLA